ncbi:MAG: AsnC family transcriptional regulator [Alphaproteobacteria bacterium]|nr:AsnC family transcriptional regulator [Alphaproteobacteria bacterium]
MIDAVDKKLIDRLQAGLPITSTPFAAIAAELDLDEAEVIRRMQHLLDGKILSRFGPMYDAVRLGGGLTLAAMAVPENRFDEVTELVNAHPEVAHNYRRDHRLNMWFVLATERPEQIETVLQAIEDETGLSVLDLPKEEEFFLDLRLKA